MILTFTFIDAYPNAHNEGRYNSRVRTYYLATDKTVDQVFNEMLTLKATIYGEGTVFEACFNNKTINLSLEGLGGGSFDVDRLFTQIKGNYTFIDQSSGILTLSDLENVRLFIVDAESVLSDLDDGNVNRNITSGNNLRSISNYEKGASGWFETVVIIGGLSGLIGNILTNGITFFYRKVFKVEKQFNHFIKIGNQVVDQIAEYTGVPSQEIVLLSILRDEFDRNHIHVKAKAKDKIYKVELNEDGTLYAISIGKIDPLV